MPELGTLGSVRGVASNGHPYRDKAKKIAEAEPVGNVEGNMCGPGMRGAVALPWSKIPSRTKGTRRNLGDLVWPAVARSDPGPRQEGEEPKLPWNRRGVGRAS